VRGDRARGASAELGSIDLSQVASAEYRSDSVVLLRNRRRRAVAAVIVEVQLQIDRDKLRTWPVYVAVARARLGCPATLLVLAPDRTVARWARRSIRLGHPGYVLRPIVVDFGQIPRITDATQARGAPELAVLSAIARPEVAEAEAACAGLDMVSEEDQKLYWDVILAGLPAWARQALEARMIKGYEYQSDFAHKYYAQGLEQGLEKGLEQGLEQGREDGLRRAIIELVHARLPRFRGDLASGLRGQPEAALVQLLGKLAKARDKDAVRAVLDRWLDRWLDRRA
jgi:hypothetical protein